jgi:ornithine carbamoyltransferase
LTRIKAAAPSTGSLLGPCGAEPARDRHIMISTLHTSAIPALQTLLLGQASALLTHARALQRAAQSGTIQPLLKGKRLGVLCVAANDHDAALFHVAAAELGARVTQVQPSLTDASTPMEIARTARMLGRLYDAVECQGLPPALVGRIRDDAGVPVYDGIASRDHPVARLAEQLDAGAPADDNRRFVLQALLLSTLA